MTSVPEGAIPALNGGWIKPFTKESRRNVKTRPRNAWKPPPNPETGFGAVWYRKQHAVALKRYEHAAPADAVRLAEDKVVSLLMGFLSQTINTPPDYSCPHCRARTDNSSRLMVFGSAFLGRVHQRCMTAFLDELEFRARVIWTRLATEFRRSPP